MKNKSRKPRLDAPRDPRLPGPGTILVREWKGREHKVEVLENGFRWKGDEYRSLSTIANMITRGNWNGYVFFGLNKAVA